MNTVKNLILIMLLITSITLICAVNFKQIASPTYRQVFINIQTDTLTYILPDKPLVANSESVYSDSTILHVGVDYTIDYINGVICFRQSTTLSQTITVSYNIVPDFLLQKMYVYEMKSIRDSLNIVSNPRNQFFQQSDNKLLITGSKTFSISFSNQESFDLKQSLYLKLEGEISNSMKIEGQLSDSQSPLTPEGDSKEISSLDKVFLKLYDKHYEIVLGDQEWQFKDTYLMNYQTKFEGINAYYHNKFNFQVALAATGGKRTTNIIQGIDGKQGPYYLSASSMLQNLQVVPGSEKVSINGDNKGRGTDYSIDYSDGSITFKMLITSNSRIVVDFQYTDEYYSQNMYLNSSAFYLTDKVRIQHHLIWQKDDKNNPLQTTFTVSDKDSLRNAGDHPVWGQGIIEVEPGKGQYIEKADLNNFTYYEYAANDSTANYVLYFSNVGFGKGDYEQFAPSKYRYAGVGLGSWMPYKRLTAPTDNSNLGMDVSYNSEQMNLSLEGMYTNQDKNTMSAIDDNNNKSFMYNAKLNYHPLGYKYNPQVLMQYHQRYKNSFSFANLTSFEESYVFSSLPSYDSLAQTQMDLTGQLSNQDFWKQSVSLRYKQITSKYIQKAIRANTDIYQSGILPSFSWQGVYSLQSYSDTTLTQSALNYHNVITDYKWKLLLLRFNYFLQQDNYTYADTHNSNTTEGNRYQKLIPGIKIGDNKQYNSEISLAKDYSDIRQSGKWEKINKSNTIQFNQLINLKLNTVNFNYTHREISSNLNDSLVKSTQKYDLFDLKSSHQFWDNSLALITAYQINQLEFFPQVRELQYIGDGLGLYDSTGVQITGGDYDYVYSTSGKSKMTTEVTANANLFYHLSQKYLPGSLWQRVQLESGFQISENTLRSNSIKTYLLYPDAIFNKNTTIYGNQTMHHTIWLDIMRDIVSGSIRYEVNRSLDNRYQSENRTYHDSKELELDWKKVFGNKMQTTYTNSMERDTRYNSEIRNNSYTMVIYRSLNPTTNAQASLSYTKEAGNNQDQSNQYTISNLKINPSLTMYLYKKYRVTSSFSAQFNKRNGSQYLSFLPDKRNGSIYLWSIQTQYRLNSFTSGSFEYSGKSYPGEETNHELKMEFRAEL